MEKEKNVFVEKTISGLKKECIVEDLLAPRGFDFDKNNENDEQCVLVMGLNPAGKKEDADRERDFSRTYFYSLSENSKTNSEWLYNKYFRPIYNFVNACMKDNRYTDEIPSAKWPWCNKKWEEIDEEVRKYPDLHSSFEEIKRFYDKHSNSKYTIYIGDMFYYHVTNSKELPLITENESFSYKKYCDEMLALHIQTMEQHNKQIRFVYINNAQVSHWLSSGERKTYHVIPGTTIRVFYGGMLSGMRSMDTFSLERLVQEVRYEMQCK